MAVIRCPRGHYYDDQRFSRCPHCGISTAGWEAGSGTADTPKAEEKKRGLLGWLDREKTVKQVHNTKSAYWEVKVNIEEEEKERLVKGKEEAE